MAWQEDKSLYQSAQDNGYAGTETQFYAALAAIATQHTAINEITWGPQQKTVGGLLNYLHELLLG